MSDAERRRGIELVMDTRPEIDLDELQRILGKVGIDVDTDTLIEDLDALGFDVDDPDGPPGEHRDVVADDHLADDRDADDHRDSDGRDADDRDLDDDAFSDRPPLAARPPLTARGHGPDADDEHDDGPGAGSWSRQSLLIAAAVVVVVVLVALFLAGGDEDTPETAGGGGANPSGTAVAGGGGGATEPTGPTEPVKVAPEGPGSDPALEVPEARTDDFERGEVGDFPDIATWELLGGEWANTDGNLEPTAVPEDQPAVAAVDVGTADVRAQVQIDRRASRAGIAFRIVDERNFFVWSTVPEYATNILFHVVDGKATPVADSGLTKTGDGLPALGINLVGDRAELLNDGVVVATFDGIGPAEGATRIGVAVLSGSGEPPLFDEFKVLRPPA